MDAFSLSHSLIVSLKCYLGFKFLKQKIDPNAGQVGVMTSNLFPLCYAAKNVFVCHGNDVASLLRHYNADYDVIWRRIFFRKCLICQKDHVVTREFTLLVISCCYRGLNPRAPIIKRTTNTIVYNKEYIVHIGN